MCCLSQRITQPIPRECFTCFWFTVLTFPKLSGQIGNTLAVEELKNRITNFLTEMKGIMDETKDAVVETKNMAVEIKNAVDMVIEKLASTQTLSERPDIPPPPTIFYGKDSDVTEVTAALTKTEHRHFALLGQGGIGKTTIALAVLHDHRIQQHFTTTEGDKVVSDRRFWVSCAGVDTVGGLDHALLRAVSGQLESPNARQTAINSLKLLQGPILVIFDNFETPWHPQVGQTEVEAILRSLDSISQVSILVTMRGAMLPCGISFWHTKSVEVVDNPAAQDIYFRHRQGATMSLRQEDMAMTELLNLVGNLPLAITLLAAFAQMHNLSVNDLAFLYKDLGLQMLGVTGNDQYHNMNICVQVSVDRLTGDFRESSVHLLARLSRLPAGATPKSFWLEDLKKSIYPSLQLLRDAALVQTQESESGQRYTVHPVIRDYILDEDRCPPEVLANLLAQGCKFLNINKYNIGEEGFKERAANIRMEEMNLQAVLLVPSTADAHDGLIDALLTLSNHHAATSPRLEVAERAVSLARDSAQSLLQAEALFALGKNLHVLDRYEEAKKSFEEARELFLSGGQSGSRAADCLLEAVFELGYITEKSITEKENIVKQVLTEYRSLSDHIGIGQCLRERSAILNQANNQLEALEVIQDACKQLENHPYDLGLCYSIQSRANFNLRNFEEGDRCGKLGIELLKEFGSSADQALQLYRMGDGHNKWGHYQSAVELLNDAIDKYTECGLLLGLSQSWTQMCTALMGMGKLELAAKAVEESYKFSSLMPESELKIDRLRACDKHKQRLLSPVDRDR
jgi:tetratricopeptide (TPR) repeat protein